MKSYVVSTNTGSFLQNSDNHTIIYSRLVVQGDITTSGSVVTEQFRTEFVSESIIYSSGSINLVMIQLINIDLVVQ